MPPFSNILQSFVMEFFLQSLCISCIKILRNRQNGYLSVKSFHLFCCKMWNWGTVRLEMRRYVKYNHVGVRQCMIAPLQSQENMVAKRMGQKGSISKKILYYTMHVILWTWQLGLQELYNVNLTFTKLTN